MNVDTTSVTGTAASLARKTALEMIDKEGQERGIRVAQIAVRSNYFREHTAPCMPTASPRAGTHQN